MRVSVFPELTIKALLRRPAQSCVLESYYGKEVTCVYHGRGALWRGIKLLNLDGTDRVLVPSYHCGVEVEAVLQANVEIEFYRIRDDMTVDLGALEEQIRAGCRAVLVIHYYGFPQPVEEIRKLCRKYNAFLIEDCAHALFGRYCGRPLGTYGDMAIFSPPKSLPLPGGGALLINNPGTDAVLWTERPSPAVVWKRTLGLLVSALEAHGDIGVPHTGLAGIRRLCKRVVSIEGGRGYDTGMGFDTAMGYLGMPAVSRRIMNGTSIEWVMRKRRLHFECLLGGIRDTDHWRVCFTSLPEGICPLFFPIRIRGASRSEVQMVLKGFGIDTFVFAEQLHPSLPKGGFPEAELLSREVLCLPIHQHLDEKKVDSIVNAMNSIGSRENSGREVFDGPDSARVVRGAACVAVERRGVDS